MSFTDSVSRFEIRRTSSSVESGRSWASSTSSTTFRFSASRVREEVVDAVEQVDAVRLDVFDPELAADGVEELHAGEPAVGDDGRDGVRVELPEQRARQRGLARSDLAREDRESLPRLDRVDELGERLRVRAARKEERRVGHVLERRPLESEEGLVHQRRLRRRACAAKSRSHGGSSARQSGSNHMTWRTIEREDHDDPTTMSPVRLRRLRVRTSCWVIMRRDLSEHRHLEHVPDLVRAW